MTRIDPTLLKVLEDLEHGLRELGVPFGVVGALVPELLLAARPASMTNDADVVVAVQTRAEFDTLQRQLADYGFNPTALAHRLRHKSGGMLDILPYSESIAPDDRLQLGEDMIFNMAGFRHVVSQAVSTAIEGGLTLPLAPLPLYALLKLVAFSDRGAPKDLAGVLHCLEHYLEDDERRYGVEFDGAGVPWDYTCAHLLGLDARHLLDDSTRRSISGVLARFDGPDAHAVGLASDPGGRGWVDDHRRNQVFDLFRWYRRGLSL